MNKMVDEESSMTEWKRWLVMHMENSGVRPDITNIGIFEAYDKFGAERTAQRQWNTIAVLRVEDLDSLPDGWSFYVG